MAPDPPRVWNECLRSVDSNLLAIINSDESDSNNEDVDSPTGEYMLPGGYTLFIGEASGTSYHNNSGLMGDDDSVDDDRYGYDDDDDDDGGGDNDENKNAFMNLSSLNEPNSTDMPASAQLNRCFVMEVQEEKECGDGKGHVQTTDANDYRGETRSDINVDCDQVKAAMIGFSLPPSSIPAWAIGISDQDIASYVNKLLSNIKK